MPSAEVQGGLRHEWAPSLWSGSRHRPGALSLVDTEHRTRALLRSHSLIGRGTQIVRLRGSTRLSALLEKGPAAP
jgi:hypothetical protein